MTNVSDEREMFEIDVGDPLESERSFCGDSSVWLSKRLSDGKSSEVTYHRHRLTQEHRRSDVQKQGGS